MYQACPEVSGRNKTDFVLQDFILYNFQNTVTCIIFNLIFGGINCFPYFIGEEIICPRSQNSELEKTG